MKIQKINDWTWRVPREGRMLTDGIVFADERLLEAFAFF